MAASPPPWLRATNAATPATPSVKAVTFESQSVFGRTFVEDRDAMACTLTRALTLGLLNFDGTVDAHAAATQPGATRSLLWAYVHYLWQQPENRDASAELRAMSAAPGAPDQADAAAFLAGVPRAAGAAPTKAELAAFVNALFERHGDRLRVPLLSGLFERMEEQLLKKEARLRANVARADADVSRVQDAAAASRAALAQAYGSDVVGAQALSQPLPRPPPLQFGLLGGQRRRTARNRS